MSHLDDHDAALRNVVLVVPLLRLPLLIGLTTALVAQRNLQPRSLLAPPLLFLTTTDLFNDPRFEHGDENL